MRCMVMVKATADSEAGATPSEALLAAMGQFNEALVKAGVMLAAEGLKPSAAGARVRFSGGQRKVVDGPFAETKELVAGFWLWQVKSMDEAIAWVGVVRPRWRARVRSRFAPCSRRRTSARSSRRNCASRKSVCVPSWLRAAEVSGI